MRDQWRQGHSVLIVDSVSALEPAIAMTLQNLPQPNTAHKAAVICLPPYTRHNVELEELILQCLQGSSSSPTPFGHGGIRASVPASRSTFRPRHLSGDGSAALLALETALEPDQGNLGRMLQDRAPRPSRFPRHAWRVIRDRHFLFIQSRPSRGGRAMSRYCTGLWPIRPKFVRLSRGCCARGAQSARCSHEEHPRPVSPTCPSR